MAKLATLTLVYDPDRGVKLASENCTMDGAEMILHKALAVVERELLAARLGAPTAGGLIIAGAIPRES